MELEQTSQPIGSRAQITPTITVRSDGSQGSDALDAYLIEQGDGYSIATEFHTLNRCYFISVQTHADKWKFSADRYFWLNHACQRP